MAVHHLPLPHVHGPEPHPAAAVATIVDSRDGVVELPLLMHGTAPTWTDDHDVVHVLVEGMVVGPYEVPLVNLAVLDGVEGNVWIPGLEVDMWGQVP